MRSFFRDIRYALRIFARSPTVTGVAVLSLALGIGANSAIFSVVDGLFLRPLAVAESHRLVAVSGRTPEDRETTLAYADYADFREQNSVFSGLAAQSRRGALLNIHGDAELVLLTVVSDDYFSVLGLNAALGRTFQPELDRNLTEPVVVISHSLWQRRFGGDPALIGQTIQLFSGKYTVVGIMPRSFRGLDRILTNDVWAPASTWIAMHPANRVELERRDIPVFELVGRLRPGVGLEQARAQMDALAARLEQAYPATHKGRRTSVVSLEEHGARGGLRLGVLLLSVVGLVLLIACANVANLMLAQAETRRREIGIRLALGAGRGRLLRQLLSESLVLALLGAMCGGLLARWLISLQPAVMPPSSVPLGLDLRIDGRVFAFTLLLSLATAVVFGLAPALAAAKTDPAAVLKGAGARRSAPWIPQRHVLVAGQIALSVMMVASSGLLLRSFLYSRQIRPGFEPGKKMLLLFAASERPRAEETLERLRSLPGVSQASYARRFPMSESGGGASRKVTLPGVGLPPGQDSVAIKYNQTGPNYFQTVGTRILRGRDFERSDSAEAAKVVLVNETMARRFWPNSDPIGRRLRVDDADHQIAGIVEDAKINAIHEPPEPFLYFPFAQLPSSEVTYILETAAEPGLLADAMKREVRAADPGASILSVTTLRQHMRYALHDDWMPAAIVGSLGALGMVLAAVGLYGAISYAVNRRTHEIGIRLAIGARRGDVLRLVLGQGLRLTLIGIVIGLGATLALGRFLAGLLHGVRPADPLTLAGSVLVVTCVALAATHFPARRAARVDPMAALRYE